MKHNRLKNKTKIDICERYLKKQFLYSEITGRGNITKDLMKELPETKNNKCNNVTQYINY